MRIPNAEHVSRPWRIHEVVPDFILEDVWALPMRGGPDDFPALLAVAATFDPSKASSRPTRVLWNLRDRLGRWLDLGEISTAVDGRDAGGLPIPGTAEMVAYAREVGKPILMIDPENGQTRRENFGRLQPSDPELEFLNGLPDAGDVGTGGGDTRDSVLRLYRKADAAANRSAPQFRLLTVATVLLHVAATIVATAALAFDWHSLLLPWAKLLFVLGALGAALAIRHYRAQRNWVRCRLAAEICRAALATWGMPRRTALFEDLDLPGARMLLRSLHMLHRRGAPERRANLDTFRQHYRREDSENE